MNIIELLTDSKTNRLIAKRCTEPYLRKKDIWNELFDQTNFCNTNRTFRERIEILKCNITEDPKCKTCGSMTIMNNETRYGFYNYCSVKCSSIDQDVIDKRNKNYDFEKAKTIRKETMLKKYGFEFNFQNEKTKNVIRENNKNEIIKEKQKKTKLKRHGYEYFAPIDYNHSKGELEVKEYLKEIGFDFTCNRTILNNNLELDLFNDNKKIAIEYCGDYWHSDKFKTRTYHYDKWLECQKKDINLLTIFEHEWINKKEKIKKFLSSRLGVFDKRIYARDCHFEELNYVPRDFITKNHIQNCPNSVDRVFGLFDDEFFGELLGVVAYGKHHRDSKKYVLNRLCFDERIQIIGGASKLIKNSMKILNMNEIITWSDNRWSNGSLYEKSGFKFEKDLGPDYFYVKNGEYVSKQTFAGIKKEKSMTEKEYTESNGYLKLWDCGKKRFIWSQ